MNAEFVDLAQIKLGRTVAGAHLQRATETGFRRVKVASLKFPQRVFKRFAPRPGGFGAVAKSEQFIYLHRFFEPFELEMPGKSSGDFPARAFLGLPGD